MVMIALHSSVESLQDPEREGEKTGPFVCLQVEGLGSRLAQALDTDWDPADKGGAQVPRVQWGRRSIGTTCGHPLCLMCRWF